MIDPAHGAERARCGGSTRPACTKRLWRPSERANEQRKSRSKLDRSLLAPRSYLPTPREYKSGETHHHARPLRVPADADRLRFALARRRHALAELRAARRALADGRRRVRRELRRLGPECREHRRRRRVQHVGPPQPHDAQAHPQRRVGTVHPGHRRGPAVQVRREAPRRACRRKVRPLRLLRRSAAAHGEHRHQPRSLPMERRRVDRQAAAAQRARRADVDLRDAPRQLAARSERPEPLAQLPRARAAARRLLPADGLHAHPAAAGQRAPVHRQLGLPDDRLLRRHEPLRHAARLHVLRRPVPPERHRRDHRLGAGPLSRRTTTACATSTAPRCTSTPTRARASTPTGAR